MKVVLAEKPSVARDLAAVLGARTRRDGYLEGNGVQVTWAFGHLVTLQEPEDYDPALKRWSLDALPILPERFALKLTGDDGARKQYRVVEALFRAADEIVCATDAGREGELIFRYILEMSGCLDKPFRRLWLSSMTEDAIRAAFARLEPGSEYDNLYAAARCRSEADWIVGMNATRNFTVRYGQSGVLWSVGRVQTPVLALIAGRDDAIRDFVPEPWFEVRTRYRDVVFRLAGDRSGAREAAEQVVAAVTGHPFEVTAIEKKDERELPPQLHDLTALQRELNARYGMSAADVLEKAQALYEGKLLTYPRTDSRYLPAGMRDEVAATLGQIGGRRDEVGVLDLDKLPRDKRIFDDKKVSDHHAIIPTGRAPGALDRDMQRVYEAVETRLIAAFYPPCLKEVTTVDGKVECRVEGKDLAHPFRARGIRVTDPGWTVLQPKKRTPAKDRSEDDEKQELPEFVVGEQGPHEPEVKEGETRPPRHYTESTLLAAMETAGKLVDDEELKEALKARGLGTPATRAAIIETLLRRRYIRREKKALIATDLGRYLIALIRDPGLKSPELTGEWEARLREVEAGRLDASGFMAGIVGFTRGVIDGSDRQVLDHEGLGPCPRCAAPVVEGQRGYGCSRWREGCSYVLWKEYRGHTIDARQARELLQRGLSLRPVQLDGEAFVLALTASGLPAPLAIPRREHQRGPARAGRARAKEVPRKKTRQRTAGKATPAPVCPLCGSGMVEREASFCCASWRDGCGFAIQKTIAGKKISKATARSLLTSGRTRVLKGFVSRSNKEFAARLKLEDGQVRFEFGE